ncbi:MAG: PorP/SprF family type IX secretion system membrane protein [Brumimicrobium sp.]|nr:PorP/SprF family type IX secretion system membrane protein [Brumimicrobium sp.]
MKYFSLILFLSFGFTIKIFGQDIHFSQTAQTPLWINPAITGVYEGWERVIINHRNQWLGSNTQYMTTALAADLNFFKTRQNDKAHIGLGIFLWNDIAGDANYGTRQGQLSLSGILPMGNGHQLSAGLQGGIGNRGGNMSKLLFESQWDGEVFNPELNNNESATLQSNNYFDMSAGINYLYDGGENTFARQEDIKIQVGAAVYHVNQPSVKYNGLENDLIYRKYVGHFSLLKDFSLSKWSLDANAVGIVQGPQKQIILGALMRYRMKEGTKTTALKQEAYFAFGMYTRVGDAVIPAIMVDIKGFQLGISYDVTYSKLRNTHPGGTLEFSLAYRNLYTALFKKGRY